MLFSIRFKLRNQNYNPQTGLTPLYVRISVNSVFCSDFYSGVRCVAKSWNSKLQMIEGTNRNVLQDNATLENIKADLKTLVNGLCDGETVHTVRERYLEKYVSIPTLLESFDLYIKNVKAKQGIKEDALKKWRKSAEHLSSFVKPNFRLDELKKGFSSKYYLHLFHECKLSNNHAVRNVSYLRAVVDYCVDEGLCRANPVSMLGLKRNKAKPIKYLSESDVKILEGLKLSGITEQCRDLFLFECYTSLDNNEMKRLEQHHINDRVIKIRRGKVDGSLQIIPILPNARAILEKYDYKLPVLETYIINRNLKVLHGFISFTDSLTTKVGRKTAGMFFLYNGVPLDVVSRILGHSSVKTTQRHYADILDEFLILKTTKHLL